MSSRDPTPKVRDEGVDVLRGLAVFLMLGANVAPYVLARPYPFWFRLGTTFPAPSFVLLAGVMVGESAVRAPRPLAISLRRALALLVLAAFVDAAFWQLIPFTSFDVLYLIALALPFQHLAARLRKVHLLALSVGILASTPMIWELIPYDSDSSHPLWSRIEACVINGWFPLLPWLGVGLFGTLLGRVRAELATTRAMSWTLRAAAALTTLGLAYWMLVTPELRTRGGYAELFYPPHPGPILVMLGVASFALWTLGSRPVPRALRWLRIFGRASMLAYLLHIGIIGLWIRHALKPGTFLQFAAVFLILATGVLVLVTMIKRVAPAKGWFGRLLLGG